MKKRQHGNMKLHLAKETVRHLLSEDLQRIAGGAPCPSKTGCSSNTYDSLNECTSIVCSMIQY